MGEQRFKLIHINGLFAPQMEDCRFCAFSTKAIKAGR